MDESLLLAINQGWAHPWLDALFGWVSQKQSFSFPILFALLAWCGFRWRWNGVKLWLLLIAAILIADGNGNIVKHLVLAERPCNALGDAVRLVEAPFEVGCNRNPHGMPSNHAVDFFLTAVFLGIVLRSWAWGLGFGAIAIVVSLSRVYLGVHYPSQVLGGALLGAAIGWLLAWLALHYLPFLQTIRAP